MDKPSYSDIRDEFSRIVPEWYNLKGYATDAIIRDALHRLTDLWAFWCNDPRATQNGQIEPITAFVTNYVELVENVCRLEQWGITLRMIEVG